MCLRTYVTLCLINLLKFVMNKEQLVKYVRSYGRATDNTLSHGTEDALTVECVRASEARPTNLPFFHSVQYEVRSLVV